jgi:hypothetical protein
VLNLNTNAIIAPNGTLGAGDRIIAALSSSAGGLVVGGTTYDSDATIATYTHSGGSGLQAFGALQIDLAGISLSSGDQVFLSRTGNSLILTFVPVPEPALLFGLAAGLMGVGAAVRKKFFTPATSA